MGPDAGLLTTATTIAGKQLQQAQIVTAVRIGAAALGVLGIFLFARGKKVAGVAAAGAGVAGWIFAGTFEATAVAALVAAKPPASPNIVTADDWASVVDAYAGTS